MVTWKMTLFKLWSLPLNASVREILHVRKSINILWTRFIINLDCRVGFYLEVKSYLIGKSYFILHFLWKSYFTLLFQGQSYFILNGHIRPLKLIQSNLRRCYKWSLLCYNVIQLDISLIELSIKCTQFCQAWH